MTIAVFYYASPKKATPDTDRWLRHLLQAMAQARPASRLLVFSNHWSGEGLAQENISFPEWKLPKLVWVRQRTLRQWQRIAQQQGATTFICIGTASLPASGLPAWLLLLPGERVKKEQLAKLHQSTAGFWAVNKGDKSWLELSASKPVMHLAGGPILPTGVNNNYSILDQVKEQHTGGFEYFLYAGPLAPREVFIGLLKAFSRLKHRQKTSWKLVLLHADGDAAEAATLREALTTYKYREDVVLLENIATDAEKASIVAAAYAFVQPLPAGPFGRYVKEAVAAGVPVIAASDALNKEMGGNAALYYEAGDEHLLADCLMMLYKDEALRGRLAAAAREQSGALTWPVAAEAAWQSLAGAEK